MNYQQTPCFQGFQPGAGLVAQMQDAQYKALEESS